jgi:MEDS: MEthanogen/methylotroph, DcmR Sensory domain
MPARLIQEVPAISARHLVGFYRQPNYPVEAVCDYLIGGLGVGEVAVALVTSEHANYITHELRTRGLQIDEMLSDGRFVYPNFDETLSYLLAPEIPKAAKDALMCSWVEETLNRAPQQSCRILGELVSAMVAQSDVSSALELEDSWNDLLAAYPACLFCIYEQTPFDRSHVLSSFCDICNRHDAVLAADIPPNVGNDPSPWFVMLQRQATALREEVLRRRVAERLVFVNEANRLTQLDTLLRTHGPNLARGEKREIVKVVTELKAQAWKDKRAATPDSAEWHRKTGEILGYEKVITSLIRERKKPNGNPAPS